MPYMNSLNSPRTRTRTALIALALGLAAAACGGEPPQADPEPDPSVPAAATMGTVDSWVLGGTNVEIPLSGATVDEWIDLMAQHDVATLSGGQDEAKWTGLGPNGLTVTAWSNESGSLTEVNSAVGQSPSVEEALPSIDVCLENLETDGFDPEAASDWLAERAPSLAEQEHAGLANQAFGQVGLMLMASIGGETYSVSVMMRPTGE